MEVEKLLNRMEVETRLLTARFIFCHAQYPPGFRRLSVQDERAHPGRGNLSINRFFALDRQVYEAGAVAARPRKCSAWWPRWCFAAMTASPTTWSGAMRK